MLLCLMEQAMSKPFKLSELDQFIGTQRYYRMSSRVVLTDGTHYLAQRVGCYWLKAQRVRLASMCNCWSRCSTSLHSECLMKSEA